MNKPSDPIRISVPASADRKKKLGKGLGALMGETRREEPLVNQSTDNSQDSVNSAPASTTQNGLANIPVSKIKPLAGQPRTNFDEDALAELAASIEARGVIQPIIVRPTSGGQYQLVAGERRWRAAQKARLHQIPAIVRELEDREVMALALIENIQREDLNPIEEARAYHRLSEDEGLSQADIAKLVDKSRSHIANLQRLLALPDRVIALVEQGALSMGHARALIGNDDAVELAQEAIVRKLSVRELEKRVRGEAPPRKSGTKSVSSDPMKNADIAAVQGHLEEFLGLPVKIKTDPDPRSGAVTIRYRTLDQLDLICQRLTGGDI
ncbi:MAG: ParB/RepB/Spo0J family partition protein [Erythrobacter sp.]|nr:ParB/RepB/Spo0J family partition protein [Erythrobacter sp.]RZV36108.1 MAG: ParB/RepB/Spo0J family partition protein [Sphingomonadaceae bacterium]